MKKLIYGSLFLALVGIGVVGCKKDTKLKNSIYDLNDITEQSMKIGNMSFIKNGDVLVFESWDDVNKLAETFETEINDHNNQFETEQSDILNTLRVRLAGSPINELTWESELAVDSFEMAIGWSQYQPLINFEQANNFNSLRNHFYDLLYKDAETDLPNTLSDEERVNLLTFPIENSMATLFNEKAIIGVGDSLYKVLGNNVWISCKFEHKPKLEGLNEGNYQTVIGREGFKVYDLDKEKSGCYANKKQHFDKTSTDQKYRVYGMCTVTNVGVVNGRFIKGRTQAEIRNRRGKMKSRRTFILVSGGAPLIHGDACITDIYTSVTNGAYNVSHSNRSEEVGRYRMNGQPFRVKSNTYISYHKAGTGSNALDFAMTIP